MLVRDAMSAPVATVGADATLRAAVGRMLDHGVGSLVVVEAGPTAPTPAGILTSTDVLQAIHDRDDPLASVPVRTVASTQLVTVAPDRTVGHAVDRMIAEDVEHLPVVDGVDVVGIVTVTDVAVHHDDRREEVLHQVQRRRDWNAGE